MIVMTNPALRRGVRVGLLAVMPVLLVLSAVLPGEKTYAAVTLVVTLVSLGLFFTGFERRKTGTRRLVLVAVLTALSVAGRFLPLFKPVTALTMLAGMYLGGEAGFLVGALSAVLSNFYFGQGPWTPFQMAAWGFIGLLAGLLASPLRRARVLLLLGGVVAGVLFSLVMDTWTVLWYAGGFRADLYLAAIVSAAPHTLLYAVSNVLFLALFARPFGEKLTRIKKKYGV